MIELVIAAAVGLLIGCLIIYSVMRVMHIQEIDRMRRTAEVMAKTNTRKSLDLQRNTVKGLIAEQMAPLIREFYDKYRPSESKFLGRPVDYVVFKNLDSGKPIEVVFVEVKSGPKTGLNNNEKRVRDAIDNKRVSYDILRIPVGDSGDSGQSV